jgi:hypothetical protein
MYVNKETALYMLVNAIIYKELYALNIISFRWGWSLTPWGIVVIWKKLEFVSIIITSVSFPGERHNTGKAMNWYCKTSALIIELE